MATKKNNGISVDAVIMWVDGNDKVWQEKLNKYAEVKVDFSKKEQSVRFNSIGEIQIAIKSIIKFAPFVRNIFIVTDNQIPDSFKELKDIASNNGISLSIIDHTVIFKDYEEYLPTFNSRSIANMLHRIPKLSEHFIIFNDDTFLMRTTKSSDYFITGYPVLRGKWKKFYEDQFFRKLFYKIIPFFGIKKKTNAIGFKKAMQKSAKLAGTKNYIRRFHNPIPLRKSTIEDYFHNDELLRNNIKYRFRNQNQFLVEALANHLEIKKETYIFKKDTQLTYFRSYKKPTKVKLKLNEFLKNKNKLFMTFQSLEMADNETLEYILNWIDDRIQYKCN